MKLNTKDYHIKKMTKILNNTPIYEEVTDPLSFAWNELHLLHLVEDKLKDLKLNINLCKVETDTLNTTYDLLNKGIIKQHELIDKEEEKINIKIIKPLIDLLSKEINKKEEEEKEENYLIQFNCKGLEYLEYKKIRNFEEQEIETEDYKFVIKKENKREKKEIINNELKLLVDFIIENNIKISRNIKYINLYISKMCILKIGNEIVNYGRILEDGYGESVFIIVNDDIYKVIREKEKFTIFKNEEKINFLTLKNILNTNF